VGGGGFGSINIPSGPIPTLASSIDDLFRGRRALVGQTISDISREGPRDVQAVRQAVPELGAAADVAGAAIGGAGLGDLFSQALGEAASIRGLDPSRLAPFQAQLASEQFLPQAAQLATRTGFEDLAFAGFVPPQNLNIGTIGSLNIQQAELAGQVAAGAAQSLQSQNLFQSVLPSLLNQS
jgi:hypothetical protein